MKITKRNKGFTLIELLVTIAVIAILVLLAAPRLLGYTDKAKITELTTNTRSIQDAAERYHLEHDEAEWPRLTDEPYTDDEVKAFAEKIYDITGEVMNLDSDGNYYDIDFEKLKPYIDVPGEKANYILQNPVGKVYSLYKPTPEAMERLPEKIPTHFDYKNGLLDDKYIISNYDEIKNVYKDNDLSTSDNPAKVYTKFTKPVHIYKIFVSTQYYYNYTVSVIFHRQEGENVVQYTEVLPMKRLHQDYYDFDYDNIIQVDISSNKNSSVMIEYDLFGTYKK